MPCYTVKMPGGGRGFLCGDLGPHCRECGTVAEKLCDFPVGNNKTCDRPICSDCSTVIGPDIDYCPAHACEWERWKSEGGEAKALQNVVHYTKTKPRAE